MCFKLAFCLTARQRYVSDWVASLSLKGSFINLIFSVSKWHYHDHDKQNLHEIILLKWFNYLLSVFLSRKLHFKDILIFKKFANGKIGKKSAFLTFRERLNIPNPTPWPALEVDVLKVRKISLTVLLAGKLFPRQCLDNFSQTHNCATFSLLNWIRILKVTFYLEPPLPYSS